MTTELEQDGVLPAGKKTRAPNKKPAKKKTIGTGELKRQLAEARAKAKSLIEDNELLSETVDAQRDTIGHLESVVSDEYAGDSPDESGYVAAVKVSRLSARWTKADENAPAGTPTHYLDGDCLAAAAGTITPIPQDELDVLYEIKVGKKIAYMGDIEDAGSLGEEWADALEVDFPRAKDRPVSFGGNLDTNEQEIAQNTTRAMQSTGPAKESMGAIFREGADTSIQIIGNLNKATMLAFLEEEIQILVHDSNHPQDVPLPQVINDGRSQYFVRGKHQTVKRKFVEILARCKKTTFSNEMYQDGAGADAYRWPSHTALMFPFSVISDPHPRGGDWLKGLLREEQ